MQYHESAPLCKRGVGDLKRVMNYEMLNRTTVF